MNKIIRHFFIALVFSSNLFSLFSSDGFTARQNSLAGAIISENENYNINAIGLSGNPALISLVQRPTIIMNYSRLYSLVGLDFSSSDFILPIKHVGLGLHISTFGYNLYRETKIKLGISYTVIPQLQIGLLLNLQNLYIAGLENNATIGINLGINGTLTTKLSFGAKIININNPKISNHVDNSIATIIGVGFNYKISKEWSNYISLEKSSNSYLRFNFGTELRLLSSLYLRVGFHNQPNLLSTGVGIKLQNWHLDWSLQYPLNKLGTTQTWSLNYKFSLKEKTYSPKLKLLQLININQANRNILETLPEVSAKTASAIILFRKTKHRFFHISQLTQIRGITQNKYEKIKNRISVHSSGKTYFPLKGEASRGLHINESEMRDLIIAGLSLNKARKLILLRDRKGGFLNISEISKIYFLDKNDLKKIKRAIYGK